MNYRIVLDEPAARPEPIWNHDSLFDADSHSECAQEVSPLWFLCSRRLYVIERIPEPTEIYEHEVV